MKSKKKKSKKITLIVLISIIIILILITTTIIITNLEPSVKEPEITVAEIKEHYSTSVVTNKNASIYSLEDDSYLKVGTISENITLTLDDLEIKNDTLYFPINNLDATYYIYYEDVNISSTLTYDNRYEKYIVFNENIITKDTTNFYDENNNLIYTINKSYDFPIIIKEEDKYGIEFNDRLLFINKNDVENVKANQNTTLTNISGIPILNYHFFYEQGEVCDSSICLSVDHFKEHLDYFKDNNILTIKMQELEDYIDGKIQLPKSTVITIDDGWMSEIATDILDEYQMYGTVFLISAWYDPINYVSEYVETHSHGHKLHDVGVCPGGQGGAIKCLPEETLLNDLKQSRDKLYNSTVFAYPFYEYNDYSIEILKKAGFTMAFAGYTSRNNNLVKVGSNKFKLPRYPISKGEDGNDIATYFKNIS